MEFQQHFFLVILWLREMHLQPSQLEEVNVSNVCSEEALLLTREATFVSSRDVFAGEMRHFMDSSKFMIAQAMLAVLLAIVTSV